jgi:hypothetical protein
MPPCCPGVYCDKTHPTPFLRKDYQIGFSLASIRMRVIMLLSMLGLPGFLFFDDKNVQNPFAHCRCYLITVLGLTMTSDLS